MPSLGVVSLRTGAWLGQCVAIATLCIGCRSASWRPLETSAPALAPSVSRDAQPARSLDQVASYGGTKASSELIVAADSSHAVPDADSLPGSEIDTDSAYPIDLPTALRLAGANNLQIEFARHRLSEALARQQAAEVLWLPSLSAGPVYQKHDGRLQETGGDVVEVSRNSAFLGGGPTVSFHLADALYEPLAACQLARAEQAAVARTTQDTLLAVALAYIELVHAESQQAISSQDMENARQLVELTERFAETGQGLESDAARARNELATRERERMEANEAIHTRSVRLAQLLRLDPTVTLRTVNAEVAPVDLVADDKPLDELIRQAQLTRPETEEHAALVHAAFERLELEEVRPLVPRLLVDFSAGGFGGGPGTHFSHFSDRTDFHVLAVWELRNLGLGNRSIQRQRAAQQLQADTAARFIQSSIAVEVAEAYHQVHERRRQITVAQQAVEQSLRSLELNMNRIRGGEGLPIEVLQAIQSVAAARRGYLGAITSYNRAQFQLLRAIGQAPDQGLLAK